ncbi:MAG: ABC transporter ATP-binding protein [Bdellovibrionota bacterium]|nr:ABC transporter ATP-binding protein [Bdellovibrionota bacterium]
MASIKLDNISKWFDNIHVIKDVNLGIDDGEFVVLVGPSGCGKSTLLRIISGLEDLNEGNIFINEEDVSEKIPSERGLSMVFQSYALYPHMNVSENIGFSLKTAGVRKDLLKKKVSEVAEILKLESLLNRLPKELSGGQKQRVAIGRAIIREPKAFLFDEPLSNLDASLRVEMRLEIAKLHKKLGITTIYVTHDQIEAMTLADKIVVINEGNIVQVGTPQELFNNPKNLFVAEFIGTPKMNVIDCYQKEGDIYIVDNEKKKINIKTKFKEVNKIGFRPEKISLCDPEKASLSGFIKFFEYLGSEQFLYIDCGIKDKLVVVRTNPDVEITIDEKVGLSILDKDLHFFSGNGLRLN